MSGFLAFIKWLSRNDPTHPRPTEQEFDDSDRRRIESFYGNRKNVSHPETHVPYSKWPKPPKEADAPSRVDTMPVADILDDPVDVPPYGPALRNDTYPDTPMPRVYAVEDYSVPFYDAPSSMWRATPHDHESLSFTEQSVLANLNTSSAKSPRGVRFNIDRVGLTKPMRRYVSRNYRGSYSRSGRFTTALHRRGSAYRARSAPYRRFRPRFARRKSSRRAYRSIYSRALGY